MEFYTSFCEKRPVRLCESTRAFAYRSLYEHKYGLEARENPCVELSSIDGILEMSHLKKYDAAIRKIVKEAPVRICEGERVSLGATLGDSIDHRLPARLFDELLFLGISHLTIDFERVLTVGLDGIRAEVVRCLALCTDEKKREFYESCIATLDSFEIWVDRYVKELNSLEGYESNAKNLTLVPQKPADSFYSAVQSVWATFAFCRLCGNWPGIGRLDLLLGKYLEKDLREGTVTIDEAREILAHFFIKGCEWITGESCVSGDAQHYQNIVLGGCDRDGNDVTNEVTYLVLDVVEELGISDFPISVRIGKSTPEALLRRTCEVMRYGNGVIAIYNEEKVTEALTGNGYTLEEARGFANDGCWEVMLPGRTYFAYSPFDALALLQQKTLASYAKDLDFSSFEQLYESYVSDLQNQVETIYKQRLESLENKGKLSYVWNESGPCTVVSLFERGCIEKGLSYTDGGPEYTVFSPHLGGLADVVNSLYAIKKLVFDEKKAGFNELMNILANNWEGQEKLRNFALTRLLCFGNDNDEVDEIAKRLLFDFCSICKELEKGAPFKFPAGVSTFGRQIDWASARYALPSGQKAGAVLANNMAPTPSTAFAGATAVINSYCKADHSAIANGAALDIRLLPLDVKGEEGLLGLCALIKAFCHLGGFFMQIDVADTKVLRDAKKHPEDYAALAVRIAGWSARFVTLSEEWQDMIIDNMEKK